MKIGIDISQVVYGTGVSRYTEELVKNLIKLDKKNKYVLFGSSFRRKKELSNYHATVCGNYCEGKIFPFPPTMMEILWNRLHVVNIEKLIGDVDVFHSWDWYQPPTKAKKVTTVHDVSFLRYPEVFPKRTIRAQTNRLKWVKKECQIVIADSQATKKDLIDLLGFDEKKIKVIYLGVSDSWKEKPANIKKQEAIKKKYKIKGEYILSVGTLEPRKNLKAVIKAFNELKKHSLQLVLVGKPGWGEEIKQLAEKKDPAIVVTGFIPDEDLVYLYKGARCFVYPSLYEGFGLPVLEAMAAGCPVVTSNISSLPEVAGKAAILVNPQKTSEIRQAINEIIAIPQVSQNLRKKGLIQANKFSWEKTARETLEVYKNVYRN